MKISAEQVWNTCGYVRLSREDGDKEESNSVTGQKDLIRDYLSRHPELRECGMKVDDGYTGSNFDRPAFQEMMAEVKAGKINCIVINDNYDSLHSNVESDELIIPFKNLINEAYCRDTSVKTRSQLEIKRQRGDFIGSFAVFGYRKDPENRHRLLVDEYAAGVVRDIFKWKLEGISAGDIADRLTAEGILTPMDYKRSQGMRYSTSFRLKEESVWDAGMVLRILKNPVYIGVLEQGRVTTPSYRVKRLVVKPREEWAVVENCHEAIIDRYDFESVQKVLGRPFLRHGELRRVRRGHDSQDGFLRQEEVCLLRLRCPQERKELLCSLPAGGGAERDCIGGFEKAHSGRDRPL